MNEWFDTYLKPYLSVNKVCYGSSECFSSTPPPKTLNGTTTIAGYSQNGAYISCILNDGTTVNFDVYMTYTAIINQLGVNVNTSTMIILFDINGNKKPNVVGKDIFYLVYKDGNVFPAGYNKTISEIDANCTRGNGYYCTNKYLIMKK